jgi:probable HAF family extracellular repeat protein
MPDHVSAAALGCGFCVALTGSRLQPDQPALSRRVSRIALRKCEVTDLGSFGGTKGFAGNNACAINNPGQVVGHSDAAGDTTTYTFLWARETGMQKLEPLPGDFASVALGINDRGEVVGSSFVWQNREMTDLNKLIPANSP